MVELLTIHGPVRDPYLRSYPKLSEGNDLNSGCSVESTLLLQLAAVLVTDTRPTTIYPYDYMDSFKKFKETQLPSKESFYSKLNKTNISNRD